MTKIISVFLAFCLLMFGTSIVSRDDLNKYGSVNLVKNDCHKQDDSIKVMIWVDYDQYHLNDLFESIFVNEKKDEIRKQKSHYLNEVKDYYLQINTDFVNNYLLDTELIYISKFSPVIIASLKSSRISELSSNKSVLCIDYYCEPKMVEESYKNDLINFPKNPSSYGDGIIVGIMDGGIPSNQFLNNYMIPAANCLGSYNGNHVEMVISACMEFAPSATYYVAGNSQYCLEEMLEWLIGNNVDIINMSIVTNGLDVYNSFTKWIDHISYQHKVLFVQPSGNTSQHVQSPGMGYNVITVGAVDDNYLLEDFSGYYTGNSYAYKPDVCYIGEEGTSISAPRISGMAASLMSIDSSLITKPTQIKAILASSVEKEVGINLPSTRNTYPNSGYMTMGAGVPMFQIAQGVLNQTTGGSLSSFFMPAFVYGSYSIEIPSNFDGSNFVVSLAFDVPVKCNDSHTYPQPPNSTSYGIPNVDLYLFSSSGLLIASSVTSNNVEILKVNEIASGTYELRVVQTLSATAKYYYSVAWNYYYNLY